MAPAKLQHWVYDSNSLELVEEQDAANMGDAQTLYEFLYFANMNYPAGKVAVTFWNHSSSVDSATFDQLFDFDSLNLTEKHNAMKKQLIINTLSFELHVEVYGRYNDMEMVDRYFTIDQKIVPCP